MYQTTVAVLGTLAEFHREPIPYDLRALVRLVIDLSPDLLCLDMTDEQWRTRNFGDLPPEYREALLPLAHQTDIVIVQLASERPPQEPTATGWRGKAMTALRRWLAQVHRSAPSVDAVNAGPRHFVADLLYESILLLAGQQVRRAWQTHTHNLVRSVFDVARRDPQATVLVVVNVRHCHHMRRAMRKHAGIKLVSHRSFPTSA